MSALGQSRHLRSKKSRLLCPESEIMCTALAHVYFAPKSGHDEISGEVATAGERGVSQSARFLRDRQRSTGSDYKNHDCLPRYLVGILPTSDTGIANGRHLCLPRTRETHTLLSAVDRKTQQE
jgi:hypothetical protein